MLSDIIIPDDKYIFHEYQSTDFLRKYYDRGHIIRVSDFKMLVNLQKSHNESFNLINEFFDSLLDSIPCGINCSENSETGKLVSSDIFANAMFTFRTYIDGTIDETSINTLCFVLTTNQYDDMERQIKSFNTDPKIEIVECWYLKILSDRIDYIYNAGKLRNIFMNELRDIKDDKITKFLAMDPKYVSYGRKQDDRSKLIRYKSYIPPEESIRGYINMNGLYPWCELVFNKEQVDSLNSILEKYPELQKDLNPRILKRNPVAMLRDGSYAISYHGTKKSSACTLL